MVSWTVLFSFWNFLKNRLLLNYYELDDEKKTPHNITLPEDDLPSLGSDYSSKLLKKYLTSHILLTWGKELSMGSINVRVTPKTLTSHKFLFFKHFENPFCLEGGSSNLCEILKYTQIGRTS